MHFQEKTTDHPSPNLIRQYIITSYKPSLAELCMAMAFAMVLLMAWCHMAELHPVQGEFTCNKGHYLHHHYDMSPVCRHCPENMFIPDDNHTYTDCMACKRAHTHLNQVLLKRCTSSSDAVVGCQNGYFRAKSVRTISAGECQKCADCSAEDLHEAIPCNETHDAVCCAMPGMVAATTMTGRHICVFLQDKEIEIIIDERRMESQNNLLVLVDEARPNRRTNSLSQIFKLRGSNLNIDGQKLKSIIHST